MNLTRKKKFQLLKMNEFLSLTLLEHSYHQIQGIFVSLGKYLVVQLLVHRTVLFFTF